MARQLQQVPLDKRRWFIQLSAVVALVGAVVGIVTGVIPLFDKTPRSSSTARS